MKLLQNINFRKIRYLLIFMVLNLVEWLKATQNGDVWKVAVNVSGLAVLALVLSAYDKKELNCRFSRIYTVLCLIVMALIYGYWYLNQGTFLVWQYLTAMLNVWLIGVMLWVLYRRARSGQLIKPKLDLIGILWLIMTALMILSAAGRIWPAWYLLIYGMFYLTEYSGEDKADLTEGMINGTILSFLLMQSYAFGFRPYDEVRYKGPLSNCNMTALYYLIVYCMILVKLHWLHLKQSKVWVKAFWLVMAGVLLGFQFMTLCRTAWLSAIAVTFVYGIWIMKSIWKNTLLQLLGKAVMLGVVTLAVFPLVFYSARWLPTILHHPIWYEGEWSEEKIHSFDPADSEKYVTMTEFLETAIGRFALIFTSSADQEAAAEGWLDAPEGFSGVESAHGQGKTLQTDDTAQASEDKTGNVYADEESEYAEKEGTEQEDTEWKDTEQNSSEQPLLTGKKEWTSSEIRAAIFKAYWNDLNLRGHSEREGYYLITADYRCWHAQNLWLQIAYYFGIPSGIAAILLTVVLLYDHFRRGLKGRLDVRYGVLPLLFTVLYFSFGIMEVVWNPGQLIFCLVFLVQHPGIVRSGERK